MNFIGAWFPHTKEPQRSELTLDAVMSPLKNEKLFGKTYIYIELFGIKSSADFWILYGGFVGSQLIWPKSVRNNALPLRSRAVVLCQRSPKRPRAVSPGGFQSISTPKCRTTSSPGTEQKKEKLFAFCKHRAQIHENTIQGFAKIGKGLFVFSQSCKHSGRTASRPLLPRFQGQFGPVL